MITSTPKNLSVYNPVSYSVLAMLGQDRLNCPIVDLKNVLLRGVLYAEYEIAVTVAKMEAT